MSNRDNRQRSGGQRPGAPSDQTPPERPAAGAELPGSTAAVPGVATGNTELQESAPEVDQVDQVDQAAAAAPDVHSVLASLHGRVRTVEQFLQAARGDQIALSEQLAELTRVVTQNADSLDAMAELIAGPPPPETAAPEVLPPPPPPPAAHLRPPVPGDEGMGAGGIAHRRREGGQRTFTPTAPIAEQTPRTLPRALPPMRPALARGAAPATAQLGIPNQLDVGGELHIDPTKPGEHEVMTPGGPVLIRVREQQRPGAFRRQGGGRVFTAPAKPDQGGR